MNKIPYLALVGGFLGSGKTTFILNLAKDLVAKGKKIGIVTNDQGSSLVDTAFLAANDLPVYDVKGGCFCCNFDQLADMINSMEANVQPDVILCEPVGSCTDLVATLFKPLDRGDVGDYRLSPLLVLADPVRVKRYFQHKEIGALSGIDYIFEKQLKESDIIFLNKCDTLELNEVEELKTQLKYFDNAQVIAGSVANDDCDGIKEMLLASQWKNKDSLIIDYDEYAKAEASLAWLNATYKVSGVKAKKYCETLLKNIEAAFDENDEIAHIKVFATAGGSCKISLTGTKGDFNYQGEGIIAPIFNVLLNARVMTNPKKLELACKQAVNKTCKDLGGRILNYACDCFSPTAPDPSRRMK